MWEKSKNYIMINVSMGMVLLLVAFMLLVTNRVLTIVHDAFSDIEIIEAGKNE